MKVQEFVGMIEGDDRVIVRTEIYDALLGTLSGVLMSGCVKDLNIDSIKDRDIEYVDYTAWGKVCNMTLVSEQA